MNLSVRLQAISTVTLAIVLSRLFFSSNDSAFCLLGLDGEGNDGEAPACELGIALASLSGLHSILFLAVEVFNHGGLLPPSFRTRLGVVDVFTAFAICLLWIAETIYAIYGLSVSSAKSNVFKSGNTYSLAAGAFFCIFSGLSIIMWVSNFSDN